MARPIRDLPVWAEARFHADCAAVGLTANRSSFDRFGWDYLVEFQRPPMAGVPHDEQRGAETCRVQVKSKTGGTKSVAIKLTNALHFTRQTDPCFIVLYQMAKDGRGVREFLREFDEELMAAALKRARIAERDGEPALNRIPLTIPFRPGDERTGRAAAAVREAVEAKPPGHGEAKRRLADTLGYESGGIKGTIRFAASDMPAFVEQALGLGTEFRPVDVTLVRERFEISAGAPLVTGMPDRVEFRIDPTPARLRITGDNGWSAEFPGEFRSFAMPGVDAPWASFVSRFIKAVLEQSGRLRIDYKHGSAETAPLAELRAVVALHLAGQSNLAVRLDVDGIGPLETTAMQLDMGDEPWMSWFARALTALASVTRPADAPNLSLDDMALNLAATARFSDLMSDGDLVVATDLPGPDAPDIRCRNLFGHAHLTLGDSTYAAIVRRPCLSQDDEDGGLVLRFGDPVVIEGATRRGDAADHLPKLRKRFEDLAPRVGAGLLLVDDGDLMAGDGMVVYRP